LAIWVDTRVCCKQAGKAFEKNTKQQETAAAINNRCFLGVRVCRGVDSCVSNTGSNASELGFSALKDWYMMPGWRCPIQNQLHNDWSSSPLEISGNISKGKDDRHLIGKWRSPLGGSTWQSRVDFCDSAAPNHFGNLIRHIKHSTTCERR
jgi:hypothetical protein